MWLGSLFLVIVGAGIFSLDYLMTRKRWPESDAGASD
jgi:hypothetical protein